MELPNKACEQLWARQVYAAVCAHTYREREREVGKRSLVVYILDDQEVLWRRPNKEPRVSVVVTNTNETTA